MNPVLNQLYVGWTEPGEWINYTMKVKKTAVYRLAVMYTANGDGAIALDIDGTSRSGPLKNKFHQQYAGYHCLATMASLE